MFGVFEATATGCVANPPVGLFGATGWLPKDVIDAVVAPKPPKDEATLVVGAPNVGFTPAYMAEPPKAGASFEVPNIGFDPVAAANGEDAAAVAEGAPNRLVPLGVVSLVKIEGFGFWAAAGVEVITLLGILKLLSMGAAPIASTDGGTTESVDGSKGWKRGI